MVHGKRVRVRCILKEMQELDENLDVRILKEMQELDENLDVRIRHIVCCLRA